MPELPEVYTTTKQLMDTITQKTITGVWSDLYIGSTVKKDTIKDPVFYKIFKKTITNKTITDIERKGKNILIHLSNNHTILIHMKMTGHLLYGTYQQTIPTNQNIPDTWKNETWFPSTHLTSPLWDPFNRFIHLVFTFKDNTHLVLSDVRKFATITLCNTSHLSTNTKLTALGPDPLTLTTDQFINAIRTRQSGKIKQVLMDQSTLAGIGNIYSDESLWDAQIHPETDIHNLSYKELSQLKKSLEKILNTAIETGGDSDSDYRDLTGKKGRYHCFHTVYRRTNLPCSRRACSGTIERIQINNRSAHFCPKCQKRT